MKLGACVEDHVEQASSLFARRMGILPVHHLLQNGLEARSTGQARRLSHAARTALSTLFKRTIIAALALLCPAAASAQIAVVPDEQPPAVFAGREQTIRVMFRNSSNEAAEANVQTRLRQLSFGSAMPVGDAQPWKRLRLLPQQTVVEAYAAKFPTVRAATRFQIEWIGIGRTEVSVYPDDLLKKLGTLAGEKPLGLFDPDSQVRPLLKQAGVEFTDLETEPSDARLTVVWSDARELPESVIKRVKDGMAVVWIRKSALVAAYAVRLGMGAVVIASTSSVSPLADSPMAQLNLTRFAELALEPEALRLPEDRKETE